MLLNRHLTGFLAVTLILAGCTPAIDSKNRMGDQAGTLQNVTPAELQGQWLTLFHCNGYDYWLSTRIVDEGGGLQATVDGQAVPSALKVSGVGRQPGAISGSYRISLEPVNGFLAFIPGSQSLPGLTGVYLPKKRWIAARATGHQWNGCSSVIIVPEKSRSDVEDLLAEAPSSTASFFGRTGLGRMFNSVTAGERQNKPCDEETRKWLGRFVSSLPRQSDYRADLKPYVNAMYADELFEDAFDTSLKEMPLDEGEAYARQIQRPLQCGLSQQEANSYRAAISKLVLPLYNHAQHSRNEVLIDNQAAALYRAWLAGLHVSMQVEVATPAQEPGEAIAKLDQLQAWVDMVQRMTLPANPDDLKSVFDSRRRYLYDQLVTERLDSQLISSAASMASLAALADFSRTHQQEFTFLQPERKAEIERAIDDQLNRLAPAAIERMAEESSGLAGYGQLTEWDTHYAGVARRLSDSVKQAGRQRVDERLAQLGREIVADYQAEYRRVVEGQPVGLASLAAGTAFEKRVIAQLQPLAQLSEYQAFSLERLARRLRDLNAARDELSRLIAEQPHLSVLNQIVNTYLLPDDRLNESGKQLLAAVATRKKAVAPFEGLSGADYLNALYSGDFASVNALDDAFIQPYRQGIFMDSMNQMTPLMDGIARLAGFKINTQKALEKSLDTASLIVPLFAVYLVDYQFRYKACLDKHPKQYTVTTRSKTVYQDGYGTHLYEVPNPDVVKNFTVNRRFVHVFEAVGLSNPDSALGQLVDNMFGSSGRINVSDVTSGTRQMMNKFKCNSPTIKQMETNMLSFFDRYLENRKQVGEAMFDR